MAKRPLRQLIVDRFQASIRDLDKIGARMMWVLDRYNQHGKTEQAARVTMLLNALSEIREAFLRARYEL